ncbi:MAG: hydroxyacid dehydrogenase [archaeon]
MKILISDPFSPELPARLAKFGEVTENKEDCKDADVILIRSATKATAEYLKKCKNIKYIIRGGVGMDNIDKAYCEANGIRAENTPEAASVAVAEMVFALALGIRRKLIKSHNSMDAGEWLKKELKGTELYGKTIGIYGYGRIGEEVAKRAHAFGMHIIGCCRSDRKMLDYVKKVSLDDVVRNADILTIHVPKTPDTENSINKDSIAKMKDGVIIINTARGGIVNEADLAEALKSGKVGGAGIDVYSKEPPESNPFKGLENVIMTPHLGGSTKENAERISDLIVEKVEKFAAE